MKMNPDLDQWLVKPQAAQVDHLAAFKKMAISTPEPLFRLPSILTSDNAATWLVTRKSANDETSYRPNSIRSQMTKIRQEDNAKWLLKPETEKNKVETDLVVISEELSPWLARSVMTTSLSTLPGKRSNDSLTLPAHLMNKTSQDIWLLKSAKQQQQNVPKNDLDEWLFVPRPTNETKLSNSIGAESTNLIGDWQSRSSSCSWINSNVNSNTNSNINSVQEWLEKALDECDENDFDDFDESSIEVLSHPSSN